MRTAVTPVESTARGCSYSTCCSTCCSTPLSLPFPPFPLLQTPCVSRLAVGGGQLAGVGTVQTTCPAGSYKATADGLASGETRYCYACPAGTYCAAATVLTPTNCVESERLPAGPRLPGRLLPGHIHCLLTCRERYPSWQTRLAPSWAARAPPAVLAPTSSPTPSTTAPPLPATAATPRPALAGAPTLAPTSATPRTWTNAALTVSGWGSEARCSPVLRMHQHRPPPRCPHHRAPLPLRCRNSQPG
jgi:hypothetical protein